MGQRRAGKSDHKSISDRVARALLAGAQILAFSPHNVRELHAAIVGDPPPKYEPLRLSNPAHIHAPVEDPRLEEMSKRFHGAPDETAVLDEDQRRRPPREVVVIGKEVETVYKPDSHSQRGDSEWVHDPHDQGQGLPRLKGDRYLVADAEGNVYTVPGNRRARFDSSRGIIG